MKRVRVTLRKDDARVACILSYRLTHSPMESEWSGDRRAFKSPEGLLPDFGFPLDRLERVVAHQANRCGAAYRIEDLGGEALEGIDLVEGPAIDGE